MCDAWKCNRRMQASKNWSCLKSAFITDWPTEAVQVDMNVCKIMQFRKPTLTLNQSHSTILQLHWNNTYIKARPLQVLNRLKDWIVRGWYVLFYVFTWKRKRMEYYGITELLLIQDDNTTDAFVFTFLTEAKSLTGFHSFHNCGGN